MKLYDKYALYSKEGEALHKKITDVLKPVLDKALLEGFSFQELQVAVTDWTLYYIASKRLQYASKIRREE